MHTVSGRLDQPVALYLLDIGVPIPEHAVRQDLFPYCAFYLLPIGDDFRAFDNRMFTRGSFVDNPHLFTLPAIARVDPLAVFAGVYTDGIPGLRNLCGVIDRAKGCILRTCRMIRTVDGNMINHLQSPLVIRGFSLTSGRIAAQQLLVDYNRIRVNCTVL